jgi:Tol biopolymer transport system component
VALDERLRRAIERAGAPADPTGVYEDLIRRRERRRMARRVKVGALTLVVVAGTIAGVVLLSSVFVTTESQLGAGGGEGILFYDLVDDRYAVYLVQPDGSGRTRLTEGEGAGSASWSPDGSRIVFSRFDAATGAADLFLMSADGSDVTRLTDTPQLAESRARWSPDGTRIAFEGTPQTGPQGVYVMNADGNGVQRLTDPSRPAGYPDWSPDGSMLVFSQGFEPAPSGTGGVEIWIMDADGGNAHHVTGDEGDTSHESVDYGPRWSPDGGSIVFTHDRDIYVVNVDGTGLTNLTLESGTDFYDRDPDWSSDGSRIVFASTRSRGDGSGLYTMNADGSDVRPVLKRALGLCCPQPDWRGDATSVPPSVSPEPTFTETPAPGEDLGLGFPVCNVSSIKGRFTAADANATVFVATKAHDLGGCPQPQDAFNVVAIDRDQDGFADTSFGPVECTLECRAFSAPDVDGDGTDELLVVQDGGAVVGLRLYDFSTDGELAIVPSNVADPGDPQGGFEPSQQAILWLGGDAFELYALQCGEVLAPDGPGVIATAAESLPHDSPDAEWHAHQTTLVLGDDGLLHVVDVRDFTEPVSADPDGPSFRSGETLCGSNLGP